MQQTQRNISSDWFIWYAFHLIFVGRTFWLFINCVCNVNQDWIMCGTVAHNLASAKSNMIWMDYVSRLSKYYYLQSSWAKKGFVWWLKYLWLRFLSWKLTEGNTRGWIFTSIYISYRCAWHMNRKEENRTTTIPLCLILDNQSQGCLCNIEDPSQTHLKL